MISTLHADTTLPRVATAEGILAAVVFGAQNFMKDSAWPGELDAWLERLGEAAGAGRVRIFKNDDAVPGEPTRSSLVSQWIAPGADSGSSITALQGLALRESGCGRWEELLARGEAVVGNRDDFPESERPLMLREGILSLAIVPVFAGSRWWGFISFSHYAAERTWLDAELNALFAAAGIYGAAIARREMEQRIAAAAAQEQLAAEIGDVVTASSSDLDEILDLCCLRTAHHLNADLVCVWSIDRDRTHLRPNLGAPLLHASITPLPVSLGECAVGHIAESAQREIWTGALPELWPGSIAATDEAGLRAGVGYPLRTGGQVVGVVVMLNSSPLPQSSIEGLASVTDELALAIERSHAMVELHLKEDRYRRLVDATLEGICIHDGVRLHDCNPSLAKMVGYDLSEIIGRSPLDFIHPDSREDVKTRIMKEYTGSYEAKMLRRDGSCFPVEIKGRDFLYGGTKLRVTSVRDLSERKRAERTARKLDEERSARESAERSRRHAEFLLDASRILGSSFDTTTTLNQLAHVCVRFLADFCVVSLIRGDRMEQVAQVHADPAKEELLDRAVHLWNRQWHGSHPLSVRQRQGEPYIVENLSDSDLEEMAPNVELRDALRKLGTKSLLSVPIMSGGELIGSIMLSASESHPPYGAEELSTAHELGRRAAVALQSAQSYHDARAATLARDEMLAVVAHDLRNPLNSIQMGSQLGLDMTEGAPTAPGRRQFEIILRSAEHMNRLIQDLLDATRLQSGQLNLERTRTSPKMLVHEAMEVLHPLAEHAGISLEADVAEGLPPIAVDRIRLQQVLSNLVGNALKFTPRGGRVRIVANCSEEGVGFAVIDSGQGIPADQLPHIFGRFWQARRTDKRGLGLGLAIAKGIVEAHGGSIRVESLVGVGSSFLFTIPRAV